MKRCIHFGSYWMGKNDIVFAAATDLQTVCRTKIVDVGIYDTKKSSWYVEDFSQSAIYPVRWLSHEKVMDLVSSFKPNIIVCNAGGLSIYPKTAKELGKRGIRTVGIALSDPDVFKDQTSHYYRLFDIFFTNSHMALDGLYKKNGRVFLLPFAASTQIHKPLSVKKQYDIVVVGHARPERLRLVSKLRKRFTIGTFGTGWGKDSKEVHGVQHIQAINTGKIYLSFPLTLAGYTNVKVGIFEAAACRSCIVVPYFPELEKYFRFGVEVLGYRHENMLVDLLSDLLRHEKWRAWIADNAYHRFLTEHTWKDRWKTILTHLKELP